jgi:hypothetical protein
MSLTHDELTGLLEKLRARYDEYAKEFSPSWFNRLAFEERYQMAIKNDMDIEAFILAEVANFEKIRERYAKKKTEKETFTKKVDKIIEDNFARIRKYTEINFHPDAGLEMKYLYGALADLAQYYIPVLWLIFADYQRRNKITELEHRLQRYALPRGTRPPTAIEDHILLINRQGVTDMEIEKGRNGYLKECAFLLYDIIEFCDSFIVNRLSDLDMPVTFEKLICSPEVNQRIVSIFSESTGYGALMKIRELCEEILNDFRLAAFKPTH